MNIRAPRYEPTTMDLGIGLIGLLVVVWLAGDFVIVAIAVYGAGARVRRAARLDAARSRLRAPVTTLRAGPTGRRSSHELRRRAPARLR